MTYSDRLRKRWVVVRLLPEMQQVELGHFFRHSDAIGYAQVLRRLNPKFEFEVVFDVGQEPDDV
jgi:hypothetical protein